MIALRHTSSPTIIEYNVPSLSGPTWVRGPPSGLGTVLCNLSQPAGDDGIMWTSLRHGPDKNPLTGEIS